MSFEPRIIEPDEPPDELALPADLALLAEQLQDDARHIAECHSSAAAVARVRPKTITRWWIAAASVLVAASAWSLAQLGPWGGPAAISRPFDGQLVRVAGEHAGAGSNHTRPTDMAIPAALFQELTGPEQEGLLDLLEDESYRQSSLSI